MTRYILVLFFITQFGCAQIIKFDVRAKYEVANGSSKYEKIGFASSTNSDYLMKMGPAIANNQVAIVADFKTLQNHEFIIVNSDSTAPTFRYVGSYKIRKDDSHKLKLDEKNIVYNGVLETVALTLTPKRASKFCTNMQLTIVKSPVNLVPLYCNLMFNEWYVPNPNSAVVGAVYNVTIQKSATTHQLVDLEEANLIVNIPPKLTIIKTRNATTTLQPYRLETINNQLFLKEDKRGPQKFEVKGVTIGTQK